MTKKQKTRHNYKRVYNSDYFRGGSSLSYFFGYSTVQRQSDLRATLNRLLKYAQTGRLLDVGCAFGYFMEHASQYFDVYGIDISHYAIEKARERRLKKVRVHNVEEEFPFPKRYFDVVTCFEVIEHLYHPDRLLKNIYRVLKTGGFLYISTPNNNLLRRILVGSLEHLDHHVSLMHLSEFEKLLEKNGFVVVQKWTSLPKLCRKLPVNIGISSSIIARKV